MKNKIILACIVIIVSLFIYLTNRTTYINCEITDFYENKESTTYSNSFYINKRKKLIFDYKHNQLDSEWNDNQIKFENSDYFLFLNRYNYNINGVRKNNYNFNCRGTCKRYYYRKI